MVSVVPGIANEDREAGAGQGDLHKTSAFVTRESGDNVRRYSTRC